jgi:hypothetical protein
MYIISSRIQLWWDMDYPLHTPYRSAGHRHPPLHHQGEENSGSLYDQQVRYYPTTTPQTGTFVPNLGVNDHSRPENWEMDNTGKQS